MKDKVIKIFLSVLFLALLLSVFLTDGNDSELLICACITAVSSLVYIRNKKHKCEM